MVKRATLYLSAIMLALAFLTPSFSAAEDELPCELGMVKWQRDLAAAKETSANTGKPILVLFQEVPGCQTCQDFGNQPLSHPLMVEAIEDLFVPVLVYNNKPEDEAILKSFNEPSWNNPVVRYLDQNGKDLIPRKDRVWEMSAMASRMIECLKAADRDVPAYLESVASEGVASPKKATFAMHCYWEGEAHIGRLDGVLSTRSAWVGEKEVVEVTFDDSRLEYANLLARADEMECASVVYAHDEQQKAIAEKHGSEEIESAAGESFETRDAKLSDQKYYLRNSVYRHLPLTELQAVKINAMLGPQKKVDHESIMKLLSPRQQTIQRLIVERVKTGDEDSLAEFIFPDRGADLIDYHHRLSTFLFDSK